MSDKSKIEWCDATWNPVTGCSKVSEGCRNCYALTFAERWRGTPGHYFENGFDVQLRPDKLDQPLKWQRPRRIFVNSMSDLFHPDVPDDFIDQVFAVMALAPQHTFQILTKRPDRMLEYLSNQPLARRRWETIMRTTFGRANAFPRIVLPNVWLGVSVENQKAADERIPLLLQTPAVVRFLSCEPLLGPVDLTGIVLKGHRLNVLSGAYADQHIKTFLMKQQRIHQVIVGGESGHKARPMHPEWARSLRDQCQAAGVPFFFKQWGEWAEVQQINTQIISLPKQAAIIGFDGKDETDLPMMEYSDFNAIVYRFGKKVAGRLLDGRTWDEFPVTTYETPPTKAMAVPE